MRRGPAPSGAGRPAEDADRGPGESLRDARMAARRALFSLKRDKVEMAGGLELEMTLLAWLRTAIAVMVLGFVLARTEIAARPAWDVAARPHAGARVGLAAIVLGGAVSALAALRYVAAHKALRSGQIRRPTALGPAAVAFGAAAVGLVVLLLVRMVF